MVLDSIVQHLLPELGILAGSHIADDTATALCVRIHGTRAEAIAKHREGMEREGVGKYLVKNCAVQTLKTATVAIVAYGIDYMVGIENRAWNIHHVMIYGISGLKYLTAISNTATAGGMDNLAWLTSIPTRMCLRALGNR